MQLVCLLTSVRNKTRLIIRKILLSQSPLQFSGGERGRFVTIDQIIIGFRWEYLVWLLCLVIHECQDWRSGWGEERRQDLLWWVNGPNTHNYNWLPSAPCLPSDDLGLGINSRHLPLSPGPDLTGLDWTTQTKSSSCPECPGWPGHHFSKQKSLHSQKPRQIWPICTERGRRWITRSSLLLLQTSGNQLSRILKLSEGLWSWYWEKWRDDRHLRKSTRSR